MIPYNFKDINVDADLPIFVCIYKTGVGERG
jgi:hypothetical protein